MQKCEQQLVASEVIPTLNSQIERFSRPSPPLHSPALETQYGFAVRSQWRATCPIRLRKRRWPNGQISWFVRTMHADRFPRGPGVQKNPAVNPSSCCCCGFNPLVSASWYTAGEVTRRNVFVHLINDFFSSIWSLEGFFFFYSLTCFRKFSLLYQQQYVLKYVRIIEIPFNS